MQVKELPGMTKYLMVLKDNTGFAGWLKKPSSLTVARGFFYATPDSKGLCEPSPLIVEIEASQPAYIRQLIREHYAQGASSTKIAKLTVTEPFLPESIHSIVLALIEVPQWGEISSAKRVLRTENAHKTIGEQS